MTSTSSISSPPPRGIVPVPPPRSPTKVLPKRGGINRVFGLYLGGSPLDNVYKQTVATRFTYRYATQCRNVKTSSLVEKQLTSARDSTINPKFDGKHDTVF